MSALEIKREKARLYVRKYEAAHRSQRNKRSAEWRAANPEKTRAIGAAWRRRNPESVRAKKARYAKRHSAYTRKKAKAWRVENPERVRAHRRNRRALKKNAVGKHTAADIRALFSLQGGKCPACRESIKGGYDVDHIMPLVSGGRNDRINLQLLCSPCNQQKKARHPIEFMQSLGFLL